MNAATRACAPSGMAWDGINWPDVQHHVRRLTTRIVKAAQAGKHNKVKALQWLLTHSFSGKALAVRRVTTNQGKNTPGVDNVVWKTPEAKTNAIASMKRRGYSPLPLRQRIELARAAICAVAVGKFLALEAPLYLGHTRAS